MSIVLAGKIISGIKDYNKKTADLEPFGGRYTPQEKRTRATSQKVFMDKMMRDSDRSNNKSAGTGSYARKGGGGVARGPTVAEQVAARKAAKLAARKSKGQAQRKKYEQAMTQDKKMKLLFN
tara:strand:- start:469 stop:834 length:366 start_codon:yes stop_codon:yes gene_type:complete